MRSITMAMIPFGGSVTVDPSVKSIKEHIPQGTATTRISGVAVTSSEKGIAFGCWK